MLILFSLAIYHLHLLHKYFTFNHLFIIRYNHHTETSPWNSIEFPLHFFSIQFKAFNHIYMAKFNKTSHALQNRHTYRKTDQQPPLPLIAAITGIIWMNVMSFVCTRACYRCHTSSIAYESPLYAATTISCRWYVIILHVLISRALLWWYNARSHIALHTMLKKNTLLRRRVSIKFGCDDNGEKN